ncbi:MAG: hypothetical protein WD768_14495 [Phycisphaeraceae bacterium]
MTVCRTMLVLALASSIFPAMSVAADDLPAFEALPVIKEFPDPLVTLDGARITTKEQWEAKRRPELKHLFQHYMYGYFPSAPERITAKVVAEDKNYLGGKATKKLVNIAFGPEGCPTIDLLLVIPNTRQGTGGRAPCFVGLNFNGNHTTTDDPTIPLAKGWMRPGAGVKDNKATDAGRGTSAGRWEFENAIDQGFAVATFYYGDVVPDKNDRNAGAFPFFRPAGQKEAGPHEWSAIGAWAYGIHRAVDYLTSDSDIDAKHIFALGHSRNGKAALLAAAFDDRIAGVVANMAGCGGSGPSRNQNPKAETVKRINTSFPHWFCDTFKAFNDQTEKLPFDQHCLVAICAPRPVLFTAAEQDQWANPDGQHQVLIAANPVYALYGLKGIDPSEKADFNKLLGTTLHYHYDPGKHAVTKAHWDVYIRFAKLHMKASK